jgi:hypothetical protein
MAAANRLRPGEDRGALAEAWAREEDDAANPVLAGLRNPLTSRRHARPILPLKTTRIP